MWRIKREAVRSITYTNNQCDTLTDIDISNDHGLFPEHMVAIQNKTPRQILKNKCRNSPNLSSFFNLNLPLNWNDYYGIMTWRTDVDKILGLVSSDTEDTCSTDEESHIEDSQFSPSLLWYTAEFVYMRIFNSTNSVWCNRRNCLYIIMWIFINTPSLFSSPKRIKLI